jgi:hypothetical protein
LAGVTLKDLVEGRGQMAGAAQKNLPADSTVKTPTAAQ